MKVQKLAGVVAALLALTALPLRAQTTVEGGVVVHSGPVTGGVLIGEPPPPTVVYAEPVREVIVVEQVHVPNGNAYGWWRNHGYQEVTVYYDGSRFFPRPRPGLREVVVYQRAGRYYQAEGWKEEHHGKGHHGHGRGHDDDD